MVPITLKKQKQLKNKIKKSHYKVMLTNRGEKEKTMKRLPQTILNSSMNPFKEHWGW